MKTKLRHYHVLARGEHFLTCWKTLASGEIFAGIQRDDLDAECDKVRAVDHEILRLETKLRGLRLERSKARGGLARLLIRFARGVCSHPKFGDDSPFYRALGFIPISENRSGRPRKPQ